MSHAVRVCLAIVVLAVAGVAGAEVVPVVSFDQAAVGTSPPGWTLRGTNGYASKMAIAEVGVDGPLRRCLEVNYDFEPTRNPGGLNPGTKTCVVGCWIALPANTRRLRLTLGGDGSGSPLVVSVGETGEWFNFEAGPLNWQGWRAIEVDLQSKYRDSGGANQNGKLDPPLYLASVNVLQAEVGPQKGALQLLSVEAITTPATPLDRVTFRLGGSAAEGVVPLSAVDGLSLVLTNPTPTAIAGDLRCRIVPFAGAEVEQQMPCTLAAGATVGFALKGLPPRCSYYEIAADLVSSDDSRLERLAAVVVPEPAAAPAASRFGLGLLDNPASATGQARLVRSLGAGWTIVKIPSTMVYRRGAECDFGAADALVDAATTVGLGCVGTISELADLQTGQMPSDPFGDYLALGRALDQHYRGRVLAWLPPALLFGKEAVPLVLASTLKGADGQPALLVRSEVAGLGHEDASVREICGRLLRASLEDPTLGGVALFTLGGNSLLAPLSHLEELPLLLMTCRRSAPVWYLNCNVTGALEANDQPAEQELQARQARALAIALLRWTSLARRQDRVHYQALEQANVSVNLFQRAGVPKPSAAAFATLASLFGEASAGQREVRGPLVLQSFSTPSGPLLAMWSEGEPPTPTIVRGKVTGKAQRIDFLGGRDDLKAGEVEVPVAGEPVYIQGQFTPLPPQ